MTTTYAIAVFSTANPDTLIAGDADSYAAALRTAGAAAARALDDHRNTQTNPSSKPATAISIDGIVITTICSHNATQTLAKIHDAIHNLIEKRTAAT